MQRFLCQTGYCQSIFFLFLMMLTSCANDVLAKYIGQRLDPLEVIFFRFFFSVITIIPFILKYGMPIFKTSHITFNIVRGVLGVVSFYLYTLSLVQLQLVEVVTILWSIPLFVLILSVLFLNERVSAARWIATVIGFWGLTFISMYNSDTSFSFKLIYLIPTTSAFLFALQDVMIKKIVCTENRITMLLYFSITATVLTFIPAICVWVIPTLFELAMLLLVGCFANLMQYFIFRAFESTELSALAPFRYIEFLLSALVGFLFFAEIPGINTIIGAAVLVPSTLYLAYHETKKVRKKIQDMQ